MRSLFLKKIFTWFVVLVIFWVLINLPHLRDVYFVARVRAAVGFVFYPFQYVAEAVVSSVYSTVVHVGGLHNAALENAELKKQIAAHKARALAFNRLVRENQELKETLGFLEDNPYALKLLTARVISRGGSNLYRTVLINRGSRHGVKSDMAVISAQGLVGKTEEVFPYSARVLLVISPASAVSALDERTRDFGVIEGRGTAPLSMKYVPASSDIQINDQVVTSGMSDIFPPGIPVGRIIKTQKKDYDIFQLVKVKPLVDFAKLNQLFIVLNTLGK